MSPRILYAEVPGFYAEVERARDPAIGDRPVVVGGDPRKRGLVQAATPDAVAAGVEVGMPVLEALERCPRARALRTDMARYREASKRLRACLARVSERIEPAGLGAAYADLGGTGEAAAALGQELRARVAEELRLPLRVGVGPAKFLARLAAEEAGAQGLRVLDPEEVADFLHPLPVARLPGVGPRTQARLDDVGVRTVGDLAKCDRAAIEAALGNHGLAILELAAGQGSTRVRLARHPRTLSQEATLPAPEIDRAVLGEHLQGLAERVARALELEEAAARRIVLKLRWEDGERSTRSRTLERGVSAAGPLRELAEALLERTQAGSRPLRLLGLAVSNLVRRRPEDERQLPLFDEG